MYQVEYSDKAYCGLEESKITSKAKLFCAVGYTAYGTADENIDVTVINVITVEDLTEYITHDSVKYICKLTELDANLFFAVLNDIRYYFQSDFETSLELV
jgi:hypothetical protein